MSRDSQSQSAWEDIAWDVDHMSDTELMAVVYGFRWGEQYFTCDENDNLILAPGVTLDILREALTEHYFYAEPNDYDDVDYDRSVGN